MKRVVVFGSLAVLLFLASASASQTSEKHICTCNKCVRVPGNFAQCTYYKPENAQVKCNVAGRRVRMTKEEFCKNHCLYNVDNTLQFLPTIKTCSPADETSTIYEMSGFDVNHNGDVNAHNLNRWIEEDYIPSGYAEDPNMFHTVLQERGVSHEESKSSLAAARQAHALRVQKRNDKYLDQAKQLAEMYNLDMSHLERIASSSGFYEAWISAIDAAFKQLGSSSPYGSAMLTHRLTEFNKSLKRRGLFITYDDAKFDFVTNPLNHRVPNQASSSVPEQSSIGSEYSDSMESESSIFAGADQIDEVTLSTPDSPEDYSSESSIPESSSPDSGSDVSGDDME